MCNVIGKPILLLLQFAVALIRVGFHNDIYGAD